MEAFNRSRYRVQWAVTEKRGVWFGGLGGDRKIFTEGLSLS